MQNFFFKVLHLYLSCLSDLQYLDTKYEFIRIHHLGLVVFTYIHAQTDRHHHNKSIHEIRMPQNVYINQNFEAGFLLSLTYKKRKYCFWVKFFEVQILMDLHVLRSPESENHIFSKWSVRMCVCVCLCVCLLSA